MFGVVGVGVVDDDDDDDAGAAGAAGAADVDVVEASAEGDWDVIPQPVDPLLQFPVLLVCDVVWSNPFGLDTAGAVVAILE